MPWTLRYSNDIDGRVTRNAHRALFADIPEVQSIDVLRHPVPSLVVTFRGTPEEEPDSPALRRIHDQYGWVERPVLERRISDRLIGFESTLERGPNRNGDEFPPPDVRDQIIQQYLANPEGRSRLAQSMAAPIRRSLDYQATARRTFLVEPLPEGALPTYDRDPDVSLVSGLMPDPLTVPEWVQPGQWAHNARADRYAFIVNLTGPAHSYRYVRVENWRFERDEDVISLGTFVVEWKPCEKPREPRAAWAHLIDGLLEDDE